VDDIEIPSDASAKERGALQRTRTVARLLDEAVPVPGTDRRIGLDPLIGLAPVSGDLVAAAIGAYIVVEAAYAGTPPAVLARMVGNIAVDTAVGSVPVVGDLFDAVWKSNVRNVELFAESLQEQVSNVE
jgi:hypothetical protein